MTSKDAVLYTDSYVELVTMPLDGGVPDGVVVAANRLYVDREEIGQILGVDTRLFGGYRIDYFTVQ